jgi:hypothetical protein
MGRPPLPQTTSSLIRHQQHRFRIRRKEQPSGEKHGPVHGNFHRFDGHFFRRHSPHSLENRLWRHLKTKQLLPIARRFLRQSGDGHAMRRLAPEIPDHVARRPNPQRRFTFHLELRLALDGFV